MKLGIVIYTPEAETVSNVLRLGMFALKQGDRVKLFLLARGVECEKLDTERFKVTAQMQEFLDAELKGIRSDSTNFPVTTYFYGGEWNYDHHYSYTPDPRYTGGEPYVLGEAALKNLNRQLAMFKAVGERCRKESPGTKLILQWGAPMNTIGFLANGFPNALIDGYGMDAPMFELTPEVPWLTGCINQLWQVRQEIARLGRPQLPISWCEGPFFPTNEGALSEREQAENQVRYWLMGLAYGVENFEAGRTLRRRRIPPGAAGMPQAGGGRACHGLGHALRDEDGRTGGYRRPDHVCVGVQASAVRCGSLCALAGDGYRGGDDHR